MDIYQAFFQYATRDINVLSRIKGQKMLHSVFGECIIRDVSRSPKDQSLRLHVDSIPLNRQDIVVAPSFFETNPNICLSLDIPQDLLPLVEQYQKQLEQQEKKKQEKRLAEEQTRRQYEQERRQQEHINALREKFRSEVEKLYDPELGVISESPELTERDIRLAWIWRDGFTQDAIPQALKLPLPDLSKSKDYKWGQMLSARAAEKAVGAFFTQAGSCVKDISITQIDPQNDGMWRQYDLLVDGMQVDVKNGRNGRRYDSDASDNYIEFCVPKYKHDHRNDQDIWIAGVLSNYLYPSSLVGISTYQHLTQIRFLGLTRKKWIQDLSGRFNIPNHFEIMFSRRGNSYTYLPPWAFVYPDRCYFSRDEYLENLFSNNELANILDITYPMSLPFFIANGRNPFEQGMLRPAEKWETSFIELLTSWIAQPQYRHSLPFLFTSVLNHFVQMVLAGKNETCKFSPDMYRKYLYVMGLNKFPLMIYDPLETVSNLIRVLDTLWTCEPHKLLEYRSFRLTNALILKGYKEIHEELDTLVAYCGGRLNDNSACGYYPLVAGQNATCPKCHHLICSYCNYCSQQCCPDGHGVARPELTQNYIHKSTQRVADPSSPDWEIANEDIPF